MSRVINQEESLKVFDSILYSFGTKKKTDGSITAEFPLKEGVDGFEVIKKVQAGCTCSNALYIKDKNAVVLEVDLAKVPSNPATGQATSSASVHLFVEQPDEIIDPETKKAQPNPDYAGIIQLRVQGVVK